ncbi:MAG: hypothetical protein EA382_10200 [Spirochaetaceae bacterium]|nr:MAG: hypothetical protein EA382_10200 [Spirochaetaceae bacterium]
MAKDRYPTIIYEQYVLGELPDEVARELEASQGFSQRVAEIHRSNREILETYPPESFAVRIRNQSDALAAQDRRLLQGSANPARRPIHWPRLAMLALPGAAVVAFAVMTAIGTFGPAPLPGFDPAYDQVRLKGSEQSLHLYRAVPGSTTASRLTAGAPARAGDRLQVAYSVAQPYYGAVLSVDGAGSITLHYPVDGSDASNLSTGGEQTLPRAFVLDDAPRFELFVLVTSPSQFAIQPVKERLRQLVADAGTTIPAIDLGDAFTTTTFEVVKEP